MWTVTFPAAHSQALLRLVLRSVTAGLLLGVGARGLMRLIALEAGLPGSYSPGGSLEVVLFGLIIGAPVALGFQLIRPRIPLRRPLAGLALGSAMLLVLALWPPDSARSAFEGTPDTPGFTLVGFWLLFACWGAFLEWMPGSRGRHS